VLSIRTQRDIGYYRKSDSTPFGRGVGTISRDSFFAEEEGGLLRLKFVVLLWMMLNVGGGII